MPESKKIVIKVDVHDECDRRKVLKAVSGISGIESVAMDMKDQKMTIIGDVDPVCIVKKLKKWHYAILTVGPAKPPPAEKKTEPDTKKKNEEEEKKKKEQEEAAMRKRWLEYYYCCRAYNPYLQCNPYPPCNPYPTQRICLHPVEEDPNGCVIC